MSGLRAWIVPGLIVGIAAVMFWGVFGDSIRASQMASRFTQEELKELARLYRPSPKGTRFATFDLKVPPEKLPLRQGKVMILYPPVAEEDTADIHPDWNKLQPQLKAGDRSEVTTLVVVVREQEMVGYYIRDNNTKGNLTGAFQRVDEVSLYTGKPLTLQARFKVKGPVRQKKSIDESNVNDEPDLKALVESMRT